MYFSDLVLFPKYFKKCLKSRGRLYAVLSDEEGEIMNRTTTVPAAGASVSGAPDSKTTSSKIRHMTELALMSAIIILMAFTPLGYFRTPGLSITLLTIPVAVGAIILGPKSGAFCGFVFGMTSLILSFTGGGFISMLLQINPLGTAFTCIVPRILEGFFCGLIFQIMKKLHMKKVAYWAASLACPLLNTVFFMGSLVLIFYNTDYVQGIVTGLGVSNPLAFVIAFVGFQGAIEAVICFLIASVVSRTLAIALRRD